MSVKASEDGIPVWRLLAYVSPILPIWILHAPATGALPSLYAKHAHFDLALLGLLLTIGRLFDLVTDPLIGYLSDRTESRWGKRKPWIFAGAVLCVLGTYFWFRPGLDTGPAYFLIWSMVVYLGWTLVEIPHAAWFADFTTDYDQRSRVSAWRVAAVSAGTMLFTAAPLLPIFPTHELTPAVTVFVSWIIIAAIPLTIAAALLFGPAGVVRKVEKPRLTDMLSALKNNGPFRILFIAFALSWFASGMTSAMYFFYIDSYLNILNKIGYVGTAVGIVGLASTIAWRWVLKRFGKVVAIVVTKTATASTLLLMGTIQPGPNAFPLLLGIFALSAVFSTGADISLMTLMADVVEYEEWKTRTNKAGTFFSATTVVIKLGVALGGGAAFIIAGLFGFSPTTANGPVAISGFFTAFLGVPLVLQVAGIFVILRFPIRRSAQDAISQRLARRRAAEA